MIGDDKDYFREGLHMRKVKRHLSLSNNDTSKAKVWFRAAMPVAAGNRSAAAEGAFLEHLRSRRNTQGKADSLLSHVEIKGDFDFKDPAQRRKPFFLPVKSTAESQHARTSIERTRKHSK